MERDICSMFQTLTRLKKKAENQSPCSSPTPKLTLGQKARHFSWMSETSSYVNFIQQQALLSCFRHCAGVASRQQDGGMQPGPHLEGAPIYLSPLAEPKQTGLHSLF